MKYMRGSSKEHLYLLDFLKFIAAIVCGAVLANCFNNLFLLNIFLVFILITFAAYLLKVLTSLFLSVLSKEYLVWKDIVKCRV